MNDKERIDAFFTELYAIIEEDRGRARRHRKGITVAETCERLLPILARKETPRVSTESPDYYETQVRDLLAEVYRPEGVDVWLRSPNKLLDEGRRPCDLIAAGDVEPVFAVIDMLRTGAFS
jgi:hypothetical protein